MCSKHNTPLELGWCRACLRVLAEAPFESRFMLGRTLDETDQKLLGIIELRAEMKKRRR